MIGLEPGDWGPWNPLPGPRPTPPIVGKWHAAMREITHQLVMDPACLAGELPDKVEVYLLDATGKRQWLDGEEGFTADELLMDRRAAFDLLRDDVIMLIARKRRLDFQRHINAIWEAKYGFNGCGSSLLDQSRGLWERQQDGVWYVLIRVPLQEAR